MSSDHGVVVTMLYRQQDLNQPSSPVNHTAEEVWPIELPITGGPSAESINPSTRFQGRQQGPRDELYLRSPREPGHNHQFSQPTDMHQVSKRLVEHRAAQSKVNDVRKVLKETSEKLVYRFSSAMKTQDSSNAGQVVKQFPQLRRITSSVLAKTKDVAKRIRLSMSESTRQGQNQQGSQESLGSEHEAHVYSERPWQNPALATRRSSFAIQESITRPENKSKWKCW